MIEKTKTNFIVYSRRKRTYLIIDLIFGYSKKLNNNRKEVEREVPLQGLR